MISNHSAVIDFDQINVKKEVYEDLKMRNTNNFKKELETVKE